jgi:hypothetical protein
MIQSEFTENRKNLILTLADGCSEAFPFIHKLESFVRREEIYLWLIKNKIVGKRLLHFFFENHGSLLRVVKCVLTEIDKKKKEQIISGVDMV